MRQHPQRRPNGARKLLAVGFLAGLAFATPAQAYTEDDLTVFLEVLTESEEAADSLDPLISGDDRLRLLEALARGDTEAVVDSVFSLAEGRAIDELKRAIPFFGKVIIARDAGLWVSEYVWDRAATHGFETARDRLTKVIPREDWPRDWDSYRASGNFDAELFRSFLTHDSMVFANHVWREHGIDNQHHPDAERVLFEAFWNRVLIEDAYEASGLTGRARTPENLRTWLENEIAFRTELALMSADSWREHLLFLESVAARARENALQRQAEALEEAPIDEGTEAVEDTESEMEMAIAIETEAMEIEQTMPELASALIEAPLPEDMSPEASAPAGLALSHSTQVVGETTRHSISISQQGDAPVSAFLSLTPLGEATSGGLGYGSIPDVLPLGVGEDWSVEIVVMGDHPGATLDIGRDAESRTQLALLPAHEIDESPPEPPVAEAPDHSEDPEALWLEAPVVYSGKQQITYRYLFDGQRYSFDSVIEGVSYTFHADGEVVMAHDGGTLMMPQVETDETGVTGMTSAPMNLDAVEEAFGRVEVSDGRVNVRGLIGLIQDQFAEVDQHFEEVGLSLLINSESITGGSTISMGAGGPQASFLFEVESIMQLQRVTED